MAFVGFRAHGPLNTGARGGRPSFPAFSVALEVVLAAAIVDRAMPVVPNRFRGIGAVAGVDSSGVTSAGKSGKAAEPNSGDIPAGGGPRAGDECQQFWAGGVGGETWGENLVVKLVAKHILKREGR